VESTQQPRDARGETYGPNHTQIAVQGLNRMQPCTSDFQAVHGRDELLANFSTLSDTTDDQLATIPDGDGDYIDSLDKVILSYSIVLVNLVQMCNPVSFRGNDMQAHLHCFGETCSVKNNIIYIRRGYR
jgi:hypothetical protein